MLFCYFEYWYICVLHLIFFEIFVSEIIHFIHQIVVAAQCLWHLLSLRNNVCPSKVNNSNCSLSKAIWLWETNKRDLKLPGLCFWHLCILADHWDILSPDFFSHGSRHSISRSDLLEPPNVDVDLTLIDRVFQHCFGGRTAWQIK